MLIFTPFNKSVKITLLFVNQTSFAVKIEETPIFFIFGRPRTGTTLLRTLFDAHPHVNIPVECQFVINMYSKYGKIIHWDEKKIMSFYKNLQHEFMLNVWTIDREKLKNDLLSCLGETSYAKICKTVYSDYQSFYKKKEIIAFGDKNPGYAIYPQKLLKIFPEAKFIYINRDYRDNYDSLTKVDFEFPFISLVSYKWKYFYKFFLKSQQQNPDRFLYLNYETLVRKPKEVFREVCNFVDVPEFDDALDFYQKYDDFKKTYPEELIRKYQKSLFNPINTKKIGIYKKRLTKRKIKIADYVVDKYAEKAGYEREFIEFSFYIKFLACFGILAGKLLYCLTWIINSFPYKIREFILSKGPVMLGRFYLTLFRKEKEN